MNATEELSALRGAVAVFLDRWKKSGGKTTHYTCQHCRREIETRQPKPGDQAWDSMTRCTECGELNFVVVYPDGTTRVVVSSPPGRDEA